MSYIGNTAFSSLTAPENPEPGWLWFDEAIRSYKFWNGFEWMSIQTTVIGVSGPLEITGGVITVSGHGITAAYVGAEAIETAALKAGAVDATKIKAGSIEAANIKAEAITTALLAANSVTAEKVIAEAIETSKLKAEAVDATKIKALSIEAGNIKAAAIEASKLAVDSVTAEKIKAGEVIATKIAANAVTAEKIEAGAVIATKIAANAVTAEKIIAEAVEAGKIKAEAITAGKIATNAVTAVKINAEAVEAGKIKTGAITAIKVAAEAIETAALKAGSITAAKISVEAVTAEKIAAEAIETTKLKAESITAGKIAAEAIEASKIKAEAVDTTKLKANTIEAGDIKASTITGNEIAGTTITGANIAGATITAAKMSISELSALTANLGSITSGTVTGAILRTAASGKRFEITTSGAIGYNAAEAKVFNFDLSTGNLAIKGKVEEGSEVPATTVTGQLTNAQLKEIEAAKIFAFGTRTNIMTNPIAATASTGWAISGTTGTVARVTELVTTGVSDASITTGVKITGEGGADGARYSSYTVESGKAYVVSLYLNRIDSNTQRFRIRALNVASAGIATFEITVPQVGKWERYSVAFTAAESGSFKIQIDTLGGTGKAECYVTAVLVEQSAELLPYFPTPLQGTSNLSKFTGTENASTSIYRPLGLSVNTELIGKLTDAQLEAIAAAKITGTIVEAQIGAEAVAAGKLKAEAVEAAKIKTGAVTETKVGAEAITAGKIATNAVEASKVKAEAIEAGKIATGAVTAVKIAAEAVEAGKIKAEAVEAGKIATNAVTAVKILAEAVTAGKIAAEAVEAGKIKAGAVEAGKIAANAVTAEKIEAGAIITTKLAAGSVISEKIAAGEVKATNIATDAVEAKHIKAGSVETAELAVGAVVAEKIAAGVITTTQLAAETIAATNIATDAIVARTIKAGEVIAAKLGAESVEASKIKAEAVEASKLKAESITAEKIKVGLLGVGINLLIGGDAEQGVVVFRQANTTGAGGTIAISTTEKHGGSQSFKIDTTSNSASNGVAYGPVNAIPVTPGATYTFRLWCKGSAAVENGMYHRLEEFKAKPNETQSPSGTRDSLTTLANNVAIPAGWTLYEYAYTVPAEIRWVFPSVYNWLTTASLYVDEWEFRAPLSFAQTVITPSQITTGMIVAEGIEAGNIKANAVEAGKIKAGAVETSKLATKAVTAEKIEVGAITAEKIAATAIDAMTITGATFRTSGSIETVFDSTGLRIKGEGGVGPPALGKNKLSFVNSADAEIGAYVGQFGATDKKNSNVQLVGQGSEQAITSLKSLLSGEARETGISAIQVTGGTSRVIILANNEEATLWEAGQKSRFLQLTESLKRKIVFGTASLTWTAAASSAAKEITHSLGITPSQVLTTSSNAGLIFAITAKGATKFTAEGYWVTGGALTGTFNFDWVAIG